MKHSPIPHAPRTRLITALLCGLLLLLGTGCVSWDPIFRGSASVASLLHHLI